MQRVGHAQGVNSSARPRAGAAGARGSLDPNRHVGLARGVALRQEACVLGDAYPREGDLPAACSGQRGSHVSFDVLCIVAVIIDGWA